MNPRNHRRTNPSTNDKYRKYRVFTCWKCHQGLAELFGIIIVALLMMFSAGCDKLMPKNDKPSQSSADTDAGDTDSTVEDTDSDSSKGDHLKDLSAIPPLQFVGDDLVEIGALLEAKRLQLAQKERDVIEREQMVTRLESEALSQKQELEKIQSDTRKTLDNAKAAIENQYRQEYQKLIKQWEKIKEKQKEFIVKYLNYSDSENKESLESEIQRLRKERQQRIEQLLKTIEGMNPQSCALMITSMTSEDAVEVMSGLSSTKSAEILSNMAPQKAAELAKGLMGPKVPTVPELEDIELPKPPDSMPDSEADRNAKEEKK